MDLPLYEVSIFLSVTVGLLPETDSGVTVFLGALVIDGLDGTLAAEAVLDDVRLIVEPVPDEDSPRVVPMRVPLLPPPLRVFVPDAIWPLPVPALRPCHLSRLFSGRFTPG